MTGKNSGRFFGAPSTGRSYEASMFGYAETQDGGVVERIQQSDTLFRLTQMYGGTVEKAGLAAGAARRRGALDLPPLGAKK